MKISNFELIRTITVGKERRYLAEIDVTTGFWFWKKTIRRQILSRRLLGWFFIDDGVDVKSTEVVDNLLDLWKFEHSIED